MNKKTIITALLALVALTTFGQVSDNGDVIKVGKMKNSLRSIAIGKGKAVICSQITTESLPDYPTEDLTPFKNNGYRMGDTATIVGWQKDCPKTYRLIDRDGTVLDVNADPRDLESLARLLEKLK